MTDPADPPACTVQRIDPPAWQGSVRDDAVRLFDAYRVFYGRTSDPAAAAAFLDARQACGDAVLLLARGRDGLAAGFTQLYPSHSSVSLAPVFILNDLYVAPAARRLGAGRALLQAAAAHGRARGAVRLVLSTAVDNAAAQLLYASEGWQRDLAFFHYQLSLN